MNTSKQKAPYIVFNKYVQKHWTKKESENVKVVVDFFQHLMNEHDFEYTLKTYGDGPYTQHNRGIPDGIYGLVEYVKTLTKRFPEYSFDVKKIYADGDFVVLHSHCTLQAKHRGNEKKGFIITDTFRLKNGKLAEHWDAIQPIDMFTRILFLLTGGAVGNDNPTF